jgi:hypothetical protein
MGAIAQRLKQHNLHTSLTHSVDDIWQAIQADDWQPFRDAIANLQSFY